MSFLDRVKNFFPVSMGTAHSKRIGDTSAGGSKSTNKNLGNVIFPSGLARTKKGLDDWQAAITQAEDPFWPFRVEMQKLYEQSVLNEHLSACIERRKDLTLLRDFELQNANGEKDKTWTDYFKKTWFTHNVLNYILDAQTYGYNLISIGDIRNNIPVNPSIIRRWNIRPDTHEVTPFEVNPFGFNFLDSPYRDWHIWVPTLPTNGISNCGYGLLYNVAKTEIFLKNNLAFNTSFIEMFAQPYRKLKTSKTDEAELKSLEDSLNNMGSAGWIILDLMDELEFMSDGAKGNGYKSYNDIEHRLEAKISKFWLGHADAIDSVPGKLGSTQTQTSGGNTNDTAAASPVAKALRDKQTKDGAFVEPIVNEQVIPKLRRLGIMIPEGLSFKFLNDAEERAIQDEKNDTNQKFATQVMTLAQAQIRVAPEYIAQVTGIPAQYLSVIEEPTEPTGTPSPVKEPKDAIKSKKPFKEQSKERPGKK